MCKHVSISLENLKPFPKKNIYFESFFLKTSKLFNLCSI